jgi:hypothetical protein
MGVQYIRLYFTHSVEKVMQQYDRRAYITALLIQQQVVDTIVVEEGHELATTAGQPDLIATLGLRTCQIDGCVDISVPETTVVKQVNYSHSQHPSASPITNRGHHAASATPDHVRTNRNG